MLTIKFTEFPRRHNFYRNVEGGGRFCDPIGRSPLYFVTYVHFCLSLGLATCIYVRTGMDFDDNIADISFISGEGIGDISCTNINILVDANSEDEESFTVILLENSLVEVAQPNVSTIFIGECTR